MTSKAAKPELSPKAQAALGKLRHIKDALLTIQATVAGYVQEVQEVEEMIQGTAKEKKASD